jgi:rifampicin phosphotransferase
MSEAPITPPASFPVTWPDPEMESMFWTWDQVHNPHAATPLTATFEAPAMAEGSTTAFQAMAMPMNFQVCQINGYLYNSMEFFEATDTFPPPWWGAVEAEFTKRVPVLTQTWEQEYLPEVQAANSRLRDTDYAALDTAALLDFIDETRRERARIWDVHMQVVMPIMGAASRFGEVYEQLLGKGDGATPYLLLQGYENKSVESGKALWQLSRRALAEPSVVKLLADTPVSELPDALRKSAPAFWDDMQRYLQEYGWRSDAFELADSAWIEDPSVPLAALQDMLDAPDDADPARKEQTCREERERLVAEALARLDGNEAKPIFQMLLGVSQQYLPIQENHNFYIDQMNTVLLRRPLLDAGRRLAEAGAIAARDDVFYLRYEELRPALGAQQSRDWAALVSERRADREHWSSVVPPRELGTPLPENVRNNPLTSAFFGKKPETSKDPKVINGIGASAGTVTAPARIVRTLAEAHKLQPGDILVCEMTMPAWTPLFATVKAVVADSGGVLSHCAIVAREYRIPCVVGTHVGTQLLKDGQCITVDGAQGIVRMEG